MLAVLLLPEWDCGTCTALQKRERGCFTDRPYPMKFDGEKILRCPRRPILEEPDRFASIFSHYRAYMKGHLPADGPLAAQGHRYVVLMQVIEDAVSKATEEKERRDRLAAQRKTAMKG